MIFYSPKAYGWDRVYKEHILKYTITTKCFDVALDYKLNDMAALNPALYERFNLIFFVKYRGRNLEFDSFWDTFRRVIFVHDFCVTGNDGCTDGLLKCINFPTPFFEMRPKVLDWILYIMSNIVPEEHRLFIGSHHIH